MSPNRHNTHVMGCGESMARKGATVGPCRVQQWRRGTQGALRDRRRAYLTERLAAAVKYDDSGFVVCDPLGRPPTPYALTDAFRETARRAGVKKRLHDARHTFATLLIGSGVDVRTAATLLGHSSPNVTLSTYAHAIAGLTEDAVDGVFCYTFFKARAIKGEVAA